MRRWVGPLILIACLVAIAGTWWGLYGLNEPFDDFVGDYPWDDRGRYRGYSIPLKPDKLALFCGWWGALLLLIERLLPRRAGGKRTPAHRGLLVLGILLLFPLGVRLFALAMGVVTLLVGVLMVVGVIWLVYKFVSGKSDK